MLFLFPIGTLVPSLMGSAPAALQQDAPEPVNEGIGQAEQSDVELNMMYFTPSASIQDGVYYVARRGADPIAYFGESRIYYVVGDTLISLDFPGSAAVVPIGEDLTDSLTNYMFGNDPSMWRTGLRNCAVLRYGNIYPGIDLVYKFLDGNLKYEFVVAPHEDPLVIQMRYPDAESIDVSDDSVTFSKDGLTVADTGLMAFQEVPEHASVKCAFRHGDPSTVTLSIGQYDSSFQLTLDPIVLAYCTFFGGSDSEGGEGIAVENDYVYVTGSTASSDFPVINAYNATYNEGGACFVTKFATNGQSLVYSTFIGGTGYEVGLGIAVENGFAYVTGYTLSSDFPTVNAFNSIFSGNRDTFVIKLAEDGSSLIYSTYLGGTGLDEGFSVAVEDGIAYVTGFTLSSDFPTANAYDSTLDGTQDSFLTKLAANGSSLVYSTFIGGSSVEWEGVVAVESGFAYVVGDTVSSDFPTVNAYDSTPNGGYDGYLTKFATNGSTILYSTRLGGSSQDWCTGIALEDGFVYVTGFTYSSDFPTVNAYDSTYNAVDEDCFVTKFAVDGQSLVYSTYLGGSIWNRAVDIAVEDGFAYITGFTYSSDFPTMNAYDSTPNGEEDCFVTKMALDGRSLVYSTFLGGMNPDGGYAISVENGFAYVAGFTDSFDFPTANAYNPSLSGGSDIFIVCICEDKDTDMDGLKDGEEVLIGTNPFCIDSDNDNFLDGYEVVYGSDPTDPMSYPGIPQSWYDIIYEDLDGNATLVQQVISWLDGNHTAIETLFAFVDGNATLLIQTVNAVNANSTQLDLLAALVSQDVTALSGFNASYIGDMAEIRAVLDTLGVSVGDTDYDGLDDLDEIAHGTDIQCIDTDCDNLNDAYEVKIGTDPTDDDTDNDAYYDGAEVLAGTDPLDPLDYPGSTGTTTTTTTTTTTQPPMGIELIIIAGSVGCVGLVALLILMRRRAGAR